jgi:hypothetical protein
MSMWIETQERDFVVRGSYKDIFRAHFTDDSFMITMGSQVLVASIDEAKKLRDWIDRKLAEEV